MTPFYANPSPDASRPSGPRVACGKLPPGVSPEAVSGVDPRVVCAALGPLLLDERRARIDAAVAARLGGLRLCIENLHDPHNGAAVLRSAEALGIQRVDVIEAAEPFRFSTAVTQGCEKWLDVVRHPTVAEGLAALRADGFALYAAIPGAGLAVDDLDFGRPAAVMVGNEHSGLGPEATAAADACFEIPMAGMTRSLNLSVAAALILARAADARRRALGRAGDLDETAGLALRARFYAASVRGADAVIARYRSDSR
jgi:tRNA (guanosine-2'-O-)-methyltransferase